MKFLLVLVGVCGLALSGCHAPGAPGAPEERPDEVRDFAVLYRQNCAACHGEQGRGGIAVSLANPVYIAVAGKSAIAKYTAEGGPGALMPAFERKYGGFLTEEQINILAAGIVRQWGRANALGAATSPAYAATLVGDVAAGKVAFQNNCQRCHQPSGKVQVRDASGTVRVVGPVTEPEFLALISDQNLRSTILAGKPDEGMPDWRGYGGQPLTDSQVTDIVAWLGAQRRQPVQNAEKTQGEKQ
ncbi:cytochrome c [Telmatobacter bradus]|uniref:cytochrome c n=1 Tax=Telmatobacter bradus TaxID=474953 RepID=UPI003B4293E3